MRWAGAASGPPWRLAARRSREQPAVPLALAAVLTVIAALVGVVGGAGSVVLDASVRSAVSSADGLGRGLQVSVRRATDHPAEQDAEVRSRLTAALGSAAGPVRTSWRGERLPLLARSSGSAVPGSAVSGSAAAASSEGARLVPWAATDLPRHADLVAGRWPGSSVEGLLQATLQADAATALGVNAGDRLTLGATDPASPVPPPVLVVGVWRAHDPADPFWLADPLETTGSQRAGVLGPLAVDPGALSAVPVRWTARWRVTVRPERLSADELPRLVGGTRELAQALAGVPAPGGPPEVDGGLPALLSAQSSAVGSGRATTEALLALLVLVAVACCLVAASLLAGLRGEETVTLQARGASRVQLAAATGIEVLSVAVLSAGPAAAIGAGLVPVLVNWSGAGSGVPAGTAARHTAAWALVAALVAGAVLAVAAQLLLARTAARGPAAVRTRGSATAGGPRGTGWLLAPAVAVLAGWQLYRGGQAGARLAGGGQDPLVLLAVPVLLLAAGYLAVAALRPFGGTLELLSRRRGAVAALVCWHVSRRAGRPATALAVLAGAVAAAVGTVSATATLHDRAVGAADAGVGAPAVVSAPRDPGSPGDADAVRRLGIGPALASTAGVAQVAGVARTDGQLAGTDVTVLAVDADRLATVTVGAGPARIAAAAATRLRGVRASTIPLPAAPSPAEARPGGAQRDGAPPAGRTARRLVVGVEVASRTLPVPPVIADLLAVAEPTGPPTVTVSALLTGADGVPQRVLLGTVTAGRPQAGLAVPLPPGAEGLAGLRLEASADPATRLTVRLRPALVESTGSTRTALTASRWASARVYGDGEVGGPTVSGGEVTVELGPGPSGLPVTARVGPAWTPSRTVPAFVDRRLAAALGRLSGPAGLRLAEGTVALQVVGYLDAVPGLTPDLDALTTSGSSSPPGVLVDLGALAADEAAAGRVPQAPNEWWVAGASALDAGPDPSALAGAVRRVVTGTGTGTGTGGGSVVVVTRAAAERALTGLPLSRGITRLLLVTSVALAVLAGTALLLAEVIAARRRRGELAALRAIGLSRAGVRRLVVAEQLVSAGVAAVVGTVAGAVLTRLVVPVLAGPVLAGGAGAAAGHAGDAPSVPWPGVVAVLAVAVALVTVSAAVRGVLAGRPDPAHVLRSQA